MEAWGPLAERANEQLNRGDQVAVTVRGGAGQGAAGRWGAPLWRRCMLQ